MEEQLGEVGNMDDFLERCTLLTKEEIGKIIISYQSDCRLIDKHYPEGIETQRRFDAFEKTREKHLDQILSLLSAELEKLTVIGDKEICITNCGIDFVTKYKPMGCMGCSPANYKGLPKAQLNHTKKEIRGLLG